jgi:indole-3-acetate monooxygenase
MSESPHPSEFLPETILTAVRKHAAEAESRRQIHEEQLKLIYNERWFKMFVPRSFGGLELGFPEALRTEEALAWADGSTAWVVTLCGGAGWFIGFLHPDLTKEIFLDEKVCIAGSGAPTGTAEIAESGYIVNGGWKYASGSLQASMFTANCRITKGGVPLSDNDGTPRIRSFIFYRREVSIQKTWSSMGMAATASESFMIKNLFVPSIRSFLIDCKHPTLANPVYRYPFQQLAEATLVVNLSGMAQRFLDLARANFAERMANDLTVTKDLLKIHNRSQVALRASRNEFYEVVEESWSLCESNAEIAGHILEKVSDASFKLYLTSLSEVSGLYRYAGLTAANLQSEINRVWRNIHTASQHSLFSRR